MQSFFTLVITTLCFYNVFSQINPDKIDIVRDEFGVPHIFAKTDAEVAYGLAWAHARFSFVPIKIFGVPANKAPKIFVPSSLQRCASYHESGPSRGW